MQRAPVSTTTSFRSSGGLTGINAGTISGIPCRWVRLPAVGAVIGGVGGLVGTNANGGTVTLSYATGAVTRHGQPSVVWWATNSLWRRVAILCHRLGARLVQRGWADRHQQP